jgi:hypothetical protein
MRPDEDARIQWLARFLVSPDRRRATKCAVAETKKLVEFAGAEVLDAMTAIEDALSVKVMAALARKIEATNPPLAAAWQLLALRTTNGADNIHRIVGQTIDLVSSAKGSVANALARLRVWDDVARASKRAATSSLSPSRIGAISCITSSLMTPLIPRKTA